MGSEFFQYFFQQLLICPKEAISEKIESFDLKVKKNFFPQNIISYIKTKNKKPDFFWTT